MFSTLCLAKSFVDSMGHGKVINMEAITKMFTPEFRNRLDSIIQFETEIRSYAESGISEPELLFTRKSIGQSDARAYETPGQKLGFLAQILIYDLDESFVDEQNEILAAIGKDELDALARKHLLMDDMIIVVVGDKSTILEELEGLGYEIIELDENGILIES